MKKVLLIAVAALLLVTSPILAQTPWVHVEVDQGGDDNTHVKVNLPLSVVQVALAAAPKKFLEDGKIHLHDMDHDLDVEGAVPSASKVPNRAWHRPSNHRGSS